METTPRKEIASQANLVSACSEWTSPTLPRNTQNKDTLTAILGHQNHWSMMRGTSKQREAGSDPISRPPHMPVCTQNTHSTYVRDKNTQTQIHSIIGMLQFAPSQRNWGTT